MNRDTTRDQATSVFRGRSMQDAINQLKTELGPDAVIVGTTRGSDRAGRYVEITATNVPRSQAPTTKRANPLVSAAYQQTARSTLAEVTAPSIRPNQTGPFADRAKWLAEQVAARAGSANVPTASGHPVDELMALRDGPMPRGKEQVSTRQTRYADLDDTPQSADDFQSLKATVDALSHKLASLEGGRGVSRRHEMNREEILTSRLDSIGIAKEYASETSRRAFLEVPEATCEDGDLLRSVEALLAEELAESEEVSARIAQARVLAFIGSTGIGKTTTIAKLATQAKLKGERVALITLDTIRLAAVDQLTRFSEVLNVPLTVVARPSELTEALEKYREYDRVYIDTAGKSPYKDKQVKSLHDFFPQGWGGELILTLSCTSRQADLFQNLDAFSQLKPSGVCMTKLDETNAIGAVYTAMRRGDLPIVWMTDGQRIPEDVAQFDACAFATELLGRLKMMSTLTSVA